MKAMQSAGAIWTVLGLCSLVAIPHAVDAAVAGDCQPMDLALVMPTGVDNGTWLLMEQYAVTVLERLNIGNFSANSTGIRVAIVTYRDAAMLNFDFKRYNTKQQIIDAVLTLPELPGSATNIKYALEIVDNFLYAQCNERPEATCVVVAMFDKKADDPITTEHIESDFNIKGIQFLTIGITSNVDTNEDLSAINTTYNRLYADYITLSQAVNDTIDLICSHRPLFCNVVADIGFILDESTSIVAAKGGQQNWNSILDFVEATISTFPIAPNLTRIGVVHFASTARMDFDFNRYNNSADLQRAVGRLKLQSGETNTADGFNVANTQLFPQRREGVRTVAIVITDGQPNIKVSETFLRANQTKALGIEVFAIGITNAVDVRTLNQLASSPNGVFQVTDYTSIAETLVNLTSLLCEQIRTTVAPTSTSTTTTTTTTPPTTTRQLSPCPSANLDLLFVLEAGDIVDSTQYPMLLRFVNNLTSSLPVGPGATQVGVMTYGDSPNSRIKFGQYTDMTSLTNAIMQAPQDTGRNADMTAALYYARDTMFLTANGARQNARRLAIVLAKDNPTNPLTNEFAAAQVRRSGIDVIMIVIGSFNDIYLFNVVPSFMYDGTKNLYRADSYSTLTSLSPTLRDVICQTNTVCTSSTCQNGGTCTNIVGPSYMCTCTPNFAGKNCERICSNPGDLVFLLDSSGSIGKPNFQTLTSFVGLIANNLDLDGVLQNRPAGTTQSGWQVGMMTFSTQVNFFYNLNTRYISKASLLKDLQVLYLDGTTATSDALNNASTVLFSTANGMRSIMPHYMVVITDGLSNNPLATWVAAMNARNLANKISIISIGVGTAYNYNELQGIASAPTDLNVLVAPDYRFLNETLAGIVADKLCRNSNACNSNPCQNGATCTPVVSGYSCTCPDNYQGFNCQWNCPSVIDLVLVIDSSGSIQQSRLDSIKSFLVALISNLDVEPTKTRVGAVFFSNNATVQFTLDQYTNRQDVIQAIINTPFIGGRTNIADGQRKARQSVLTQSGDRANAQNVVLLFTDGNHNIDTGNTLIENRLLKATGGSSSSWGYTTVITVSVGADGFVDFGMLSLLASEPYAIHMFNVTSYRFLQNLSNPVINTVCNSINNCQPNPCQNGGACNNMYGMSWCACPTTFSGYSCERQCNRNYDVVFVLDLSGSIDDINQYYTIVNFTRTVVVGLGAGRGNVQVGVVTFATNATHEFYLNSFTNAGTLAVWQAINLYRPAGGLTNIGLAMTFAGQQLSAANGARAGVSKIVIFVSDGIQTTGPDGVTNANQLKSANSDLQVFSVSVSDSPNIGVLQQISSSPTSGNYTLSIPTSPANAYLNTANQLLTRLNC